MNTKKRLFVSALLIGLAAAGVLISGGHNVAEAGPGAAQVVVTNTPLPVQGTVAASQSGPWNVGISGTPTVNIGGSTRALSTQDLSTFASQNVSLQNRVLNTNITGLLAVSSTGAFSNCCYIVPAGQTLVVTSIDITPVTPNPGTNHITLLGELNGLGTPEVFRSFEVSNASSTHLDYPTGIAFGSNEGIFIANGFFPPNYPAPSAGDVDIFLQGYLTTN